MHRLFLLAPFVLLSACATTPAPPPPVPAVEANEEAEPSPLRARLAGKTLMNEVNTVALDPSGLVVGTTATGEVMRGRWTTRDGRLCRTLTEPAAVVGTECVDVTFQDDRVVFTTDGGATRVYTVS